MDSVGGLPFRRLLAFPDQLMSDQGVFVHVREWARRLRLPVALLPALRLAQQDSAADQQPLPETVVLEQVARDCEQAGIECQPLRRQDSWNPKGTDVRGAGDLLMLSRSAPAQQRSAWLRGPAPLAYGVFVAPALYQPVGRVLVFCHHSLPGKEFLQQMTALCQAFDARLSLLTAARSIRRAQALQEAARQLLGPWAVSSDFDLLAGSDVRAALASIARLRRCQVLAVASQQAPPWWRWLRGSPAESFVGLLDGLGVLTLPGAAATTPVPTTDCAAAAKLTRLPAAGS